MGRREREKGKRGERAAAKALAEVTGLSARRGVQYQGGEDSPDIQVEIPGIHWEVKWVERESVRAWVAQAIEEAGDQAPAVLHKRSRGEWLVTLRLEDLMLIAQLLVSAACEIRTAPQPAEAIDQRGEPDLASEREGVIQ